MTANLNQSASTGTATEDQSIDDEAVEYDVDDELDADDELDDEVDDEVHANPAAASRSTLALDVFGLICRIFLAGVLIFAGYQKIGRPLTAQRAVQAYDIMPLGLAGWIGLALPWFEIVLGVLLLVGLFTRPVAIITAGLMVAFIIGIGQAWARGLTIDCGCFGGGGQVDAADTKYLQEIIRDIVFTLSAVYLAVRPRSVLSLDRYLFGR